MMSTVMQSATLARTPQAIELAGELAAELAGVPPAVQQQLRAQAAQIEMLQAQLEWFKRQLFGKKSERYAPEPDAQQMHLGELMQPQQQPAAPPEQEVPAHKRRKPRSDFADDGAVASFFDEARVPVETIAVPNPEVQGLSADQYEVIGEKVSHRLAQRPGSYVVLKYVRPVIKRLDSGTLHCPGAPVGVIEGSRADVSFVAALAVDKFVYHLPLYRQHQRLADSGITVSRPWLTQITQQAAQLVEPVYDAQFASIRSARVKAMDETPIKAGRAGPGKMNSGYFWPVYGELDEVCFPYFESRRHEHVQQALGLTQAPGSVLLSDGYEAYAKYARHTGMTHAQCWVHCRRGFFEAQGAEPQAAGEALRQIAALYGIEEQIGARKLTGEAKRMHRLTHSKPLVEQFFQWVDRRLEQQGLLPSNPLTRALAYARERRASLQVFLAEPDVPMDTNHLERALRAIPMACS